MSRYYYSDLGRSIERLEEEFAPADPKEIERLNRAGPTNEQIADSMQYGLAYTMGDVAKVVKYSTPDYGYLAGVTTNEPNQNCKTIDVPIVMTLRDSDGSESRYDINSEQPDVSM